MEKKRFDPILGCISQIITIHVGPTKPQNYFIKSSLNVQQLQLQSLTNYSPN